MENLRQQLDKILKEYVETFEKKHDTYLEYVVNDDLFNILNFGDSFFNISDIVYDIDNELPKGLIFEWQNYCLDNDIKCSLESYAEGSSEVKIITMCRKICEELGSYYIKFIDIIKALEINRPLNFQKEEDKYLVFFTDEIVWDLYKGLNEQNEETLQYILDNIKK